MSRRVTPQERARIANAQAALRAIGELPTPELAEWPGLAAARWSRPNLPVVASRRWRARVPFVAGLAAAAGLLLATQLQRPKAVSRSAPPTVAKVARPVAAPRALEAVITILGGRVSRTRDGLKADVDGQTRLRTGDLLEVPAGGRLAAQWAEGSGFLVEGPAHLAIATLSDSRTELGLDRGQLDVRVRPGSGQKVAVLAPRHIVTVHGTWFRVGASSERMVVEVLEGVVDVTEREGSASTLLHAPARAVFGVGSARTGTLPASEATRLRGRSELDLASLTDGVDSLVKGSSLLDVSAPSGADVAVDGVAFGSGSLMVRRPLGRHLVELTEPGYAPTRHWVELDQPLVSLPLALGPLLSHDISPEDLSRVLSHQRPRIQSCYERGLKRQPRLSGTVSLRLEIGNSGRVRRATVESSTLDDAQVTDCLIDEAQRWAFPGANVTVVYPIVLRPQH